MTIKNNFIATSILQIAKQEIFFEIMRRTPIGFRVLPIQYDLLVFPYIQFILHSSNEMTIGDFSIPLKLN